MSGKFKDFDEFFAEMEEEQKEEQLSFKFKGKTYYLPASMPAILPVKMMRLREKYGDEADIPETEVYSLMLKLIDEEELEEIASNATSEQLNQILLWIIKQYRSSEKEDEFEGNPKTQQGRTKKSR